MENKREQILKAAQQEFMRHGFAGARTVAIAKEAGVTHAMLHYYFNTKAALFQEILNSKVELFQQSVNMQFVPHSEIPIQEQILSVAAQHFDFLSANRDLARFAITNLVDTESIQTASKRLFPEFLKNSARLEDYLKEAHIDIDPFTLMFDILSLNLSTFIMLSVIEQFGADTDTFLQARKKEMLMLISKRLKDEWSTASEF